MVRTGTNCTDPGGRTVIKKLLMQLAFVIMKFYFTMPTGSSFYRDDTMDQTDWRSRRSAPNHTAPRQCRDRNNPCGFRRQKHGFGQSKH